MLETRSAENQVKLFRGWVDPVGTWGPKLGGRGPPAPRWLQPVLERLVESFYISLLSSPPMLSLYLARALIPDQVMEVCGRPQ